VPAPARGRRLLRLQEGEGDVTHQTVNIVDRTHMLSRREGINASAPSLLDNGSKQRDIWSWNALNKEVQMQCISPLKLDETGPSHVRPAAA
jgi:hypothetical protein